jgi:hypothetical protein
MSNVDRLADANLIDPRRLNERDRQVIENELTNEEVESLLSVQEKFGGRGSMHPPGITDCF